MENIQEKIERWEQRMKDKKKKEEAEEEERLKAEAERLRNQYLKRTGRKELKP